MTNRAVRERLLASTIIAGALIAAAPAMAQNSQGGNLPQDTGASSPAGVQSGDATTQAPTAGGEIVVTGTLIRNPNLVSSSPVNVVNEREITLRAPVNAEEALRALPGVVPGIGTQVNNGSNGTNSVDLRGLGVQRNIVLLDGNRIVPTLANGAVDLNNIPIALLQRTDVLTGGASTTYGADAVSGVVNFITRKDFSGVDFRVNYRVPATGEGRSYRADLTIGANFAEDRGNAVLSVGYTKVNAIYQTAPFALFGISSTSGRASGASPTSVPTGLNLNDNNYYQLNGANVLQRTATPGTTVAGLPTYQGFNFNPYNIFQTPIETKRAYGAIRYEVSDHVEVYARTLFTQNTISSIIAPSGIFGSPLTIPANNPYLSAANRATICAANGLATCPTDSTPLSLAGVYRRLTELGPRIGFYENNVYDARVGAIIQLTSSINFDVNASYGKSEQTLTNSGYTLTSRIQQALNANNTTSCTVTTNGCVPLNLFGQPGSISPAQVAFIQGQSSVRINTDLKQARGVFSGDFGYNTPWTDKPISFALGGEYRSYGYARLPDTFAASPGELGGSGGPVTPFSGGYSVKEGFGELIAPIASDKPFMNSLTVEAGLRYSAYEVQAPGHPSFNATTYKGGVTWEPVPSLRLRGNYQRAVRAPNIAELFTPVSTGLTSLTTDPCSNAKPVGNATLTAVCLAQGAPASSIGKIPDPAAGQANQTGGGSPNTKPEKADTFTGGIVITPRNLIPGFDLSVDYYHIVINNAITYPTTGDVINGCFANLTAASATSVACTSIRRNTANGGLSGDASVVPGLPIQQTNQGRLKTDGIDLTANYRRKFGNVGLELNFVGNYTRSLKFQSISYPTATYPNLGINRECVGYYSVNCGPSLGQIQPKISWQQRSTITLGGASLSLLWRHIDKVRYEPGLTPLGQGTITNAAGANSALAGQSFNFNKIPSYNYFDLTAQFNITERYQLTLGVTNLANKLPPIVGGQAGTTTANSGNTFPSTYDPIGRTFSATARVKF